jgi:hypothetical protein
MFPGGDPVRGHVIKKDGNWYVVLELEREDGRRRQKWISVRKELNLPKPANKKQAEELLTHKLKELHDGTFIEPAKMTLGAWLGCWVSAYCRVNLRRTTCESYESFIECHILPALGHMELTKLRLLHIQELAVAQTQKRTGRRQGRRPVSPLREVYPHDSPRSAKACCEAGISSPQRRRGCHTAQRNNAGNTRMEVGKP